MILYMERTLRLAKEAVDLVAQGEGYEKGQGGFTLVEIAIVLVIIGLLLGGILKGQEMITQAKIKNVIADISGVCRDVRLPGSLPRAAG